jgi:glycosyltransferase involved in cell wall biosynthesis
LRIAIVTDAWRPQTNGVVRTLTETSKCLRQQGHDVLLVTPGEFRTVPCPSYPEIQLSLFPRRQVFEALDDFLPDALHVATEGPLGLAGRRWGIRRRRPFTTAYHTQFPRYVRARVPLPAALSYGFLRWFHGPAVRTLVPTESIRSELAERGFPSLVIWGRGVDTDLFRPERATGLVGQRPIMMYMGRVAVEKNIEAFLSLDLPGTKYVVGDGPALAGLRRRYSQAIFTGARYGQDLAACLASADVFVFPSRTDTFGLVLLEAMACGLPVAAYPVSGPIDVVEQGRTGILHEDLGVAITAALVLNRQSCRDSAHQRSWESATRVFLENLAAPDDGIPVQGSASRQRNQ